MTQKALLALADGSVFYGESIGATGQTVGEVVFNTSMTGYQEILTDLSYSQQIVTLTYPHIGNVGITTEDDESSQIAASGLIIRDASLVHSNWRSELSLNEYLVKNNVVAIAGIDTRRLTRILRDKGAQNGCIVSYLESADVEEASAIAAAKEFPGLKGMDLAKEVTTDKTYSWSKGIWDLVTSYNDAELNPDDAKFHVVAYDFGVKTNILRLLVNRKCRVTVVPAMTSAKDVLAMNPDGVFLSNGPGDPEPCDYAISAIKEFLDKSIQTITRFLEYPIPYPDPLIIPVGCSVSHESWGKVKPWENES